ncbi:MAG TPA: hypothetical protein VLJ38_22570 [Polyangiaceae bacterium]|nr:hypothetical protein [Polyangiaceae bacterium]
MDLRKMMVVCAVALSGLAVGCKSDCESVCSDEKDCAGADSSVDCSKSCKTAEDAADQLGCKSQFEDEFSCLSDVDDVCKADPTKTCVNEQKAMDNCILAYCNAHSGGSDCSATP